MTAGFIQSAHAGKMRGGSGHKASGNANLVGSKVKLGSNFRFDGGPDVYVAVKKKGQKLKLVGKLRKNSGSQSYGLPTGSNKSDFDRILLWCKKYKVILGSASAN